MPMALRIEADTDGGDDAEALATVLEQMAAKIREAGAIPCGWRMNRQSPTARANRTSITSFRYYFLQAYCS